jgi:Transcription factor zinc-finger
MTEETKVEWLCPKDGTAMESTGRGRGRWHGAWRCPQCRGIFLDVEAMRGQRGTPPVWAPIVMSVVMSVVATLIMRRIRRRKSTAQGQQG